MVCDDLGRIPTPPLPEGLSLRTVLPAPDDPRRGGPLLDAVQAAARAAPPGEIMVEELTSYLTSLPDAQVFAAIDRDGVVRGTSASRTSRADAYVFFVNTDPSWRRRGVGLSMTALALRSAASAGATRATLDASGTGVGLYRRLGFTTAAQLTQFSRPD